MTVQQRNNRLVGSFAFLVRRSLTIAATLALAGCVPPIDPAPPVSTPTGVVSAADLVDVAGTTDTGARVLQVRGTVGRNDFRLFALGSSVRGDAWTLDAVPSFLSSQPYVVALFDAEFNLLRRDLVDPGRPLSHVLREGTDQLYAGVMPIVGSAGGNFDFVARRSADQVVPAPAAQTVVLSFEGASNLRVHRRTGISFAPFDAAMLGESYRGSTEKLKQIIVDLVRADYRDYDVTIVTSDDPTPAGPYSTIYFGASDDGLLGLADNVDPYNAFRSQNAIIFVGSFRTFEPMLLTVDEVGYMLANVASHELGHLLGLYHTSDAADVMDTTGSAWDLASNQTFIRAALEPTVFLTGFEDSPTLLLQTVGPRKDGSALPRALSAETMRKRALISRRMKEQVSSPCGTCLHLDESDH